jgi:hypothetical protein
VENMNEKESLKSQYYVKNDTFGKSKDGGRRNGDTDDIKPIFLLGHF